MTTCQGATRDGRSCSRPVKDGALYCWQHEPDEPLSGLVDPDGKPLPEVYELLANATPQEKTDIVLRLIEKHPEGKLELPERDRISADLSRLDLSRDTLQASYTPSELESSPWWDSDYQGVSLAGANLLGADLEHARLCGAILKDANLQNTVLHSDLAGATLERASLQNADLLLADLENACLMFADLQGAQLNDLIGEGADFASADLRQARIYGSLAGAALNGADLRVAEIYQTDLEGANLMSADLRGANLYDVNLCGADLRYAKLQEVSLMFCDIIHVRISKAQFGKTMLYREQLGEAIGEELDGDYGAAKQGYLALKQNFNELGDYDAASWAYCKERRMEKQEARQKARVALTERRWREAVANYAKLASDQLVESICDYGESIPRVLASLLVVFAIFTLIYGLTWSVMRVYDQPNSIIREPTRNPIDLAIFSLGAMTTMDPVGLEPRSAWVQLLAGLEALLGIALTGLLGFVLGNRIRRS